MGASGASVERGEIDLHGRRFLYRKAGQGPLVVLIHGIASDSSTWMDLIPRLSGHSTVLAPDLLGHGGSAKPPGDYSLGAQANLIRDLLQVLDQPPGTIVGHSLGGGVAMQFSYQFPERCERLVLVSSGGLGREVHGALRAAVLPGAEFTVRWLAAGAARGVDGVVKTMKKFGLRRAEQVGEMWRSFASLEDPLARRAFLETVRGVLDLGGQRLNASDRLYLAEGLPTLIVWGAKDPLIPVSHALRTHELLPGSRLEIFPDAGHFPYRDDPERFASVLLDFIRTTQPRPFDPNSLRTRLLAGPPP